MASPASVKSRIEEALSSTASTPESLGQEFGMSCVVKDAFPLSVAILNSVSDYRDGVRQNILAGGDNAGRAIFVGSVLGAAYGLDPKNGIPLSWLARLNALNVIFELTEDALASSLS